MLKGKKYLNLILMSLVLVGCEHRELVYVPYDFSSTFQEQKVSLKEDGYYRDTSYGVLDYVDYNNNTQTITSFKDVYSSSNVAQTFRNADSIGEINVLVIPVNFTDSDKSDNEHKKQYIEAAFFGDESCNYYESLASYYHKSSYGQLEIKGFVTDFYDFNMSSQELVGQYSSAVGVSRRVSISALAWFYSQYPDYDYDSLDKDNDGYIDALYIVYNFPYDDGSSSDYRPFWAYVDHSYRGEKATQELINDYEKSISSYAWISYDFLGSGVNPDARTIVHESGHIFGLDDYYNTSATGRYQPTGFADMMDANLGDHTAFSKMLLNWVTPIVVEDECTITLDSFGESGDLILIPTSNGWNKTPYDEYLLLEFYTPTSLNKKDAGIDYYFYIGETEKTFSFFSKPGLKVYHVDGRLGYFSFKNTNSLICTLDDENVNKKLDEYRRLNSRHYCIDFAFSNDVPYGKEDTFETLYHLLESSGNNTFKNGYASSNDTLFMENDSFGIDAFKDFKFHDNTKSPFTFKIKELNNKSVTIEFSLNK